MGEFVPCRGLTLPNSPGSKPGASGRTGRKGRSEIRERSPRWEGGSGTKAEGVAVEDEGGPADKYLG